MCIIEIYVCVYMYKYICIRDDEKYIYIRRYLFYLFTKNNNYLFFLFYVFLSKPNPEKYYPSILTNGRMDRNIFFV